MRSIKATGLGVCMAILSMSGAAFAKSAISPSEVAPIVPLPRAGLVADNVVVTPQASTAPAVVPVPVQPVQQVQPVQPVVVQPAVETAPRRTTVVHEERSHNYMSTIAVSAIMGAVAGVLIGGAIYFLDNQQHPVRIAYWGAGGVLVGTGVGLVQLAVQEGDHDRVASNHLSSDPVPTYRLALLKLQF